MFNTKVHAINAGIRKSKVLASTLNMVLSEGNAKLQGTLSSRFLIWSIPSVVTCPLATPNCIRLCYATKAERIYPQVLPRRQSNLSETKKETFIRDMIELIEWEMHDQPNKNINFRIHESGDFYSKAYLFKWVEIANHFKGNKRITFMAYTKSIPFVDQAYKQYGRDGVNIKFMSSIWNDTVPSMIKLTNKLGLNVFTALTSEEFKTKDYASYFKCPSSKSVDKYGCGTCSDRHGSCYTGNFNIAIEQH